MEKVVTLCLFPFHDKSRWTICVTEVTSIGEIEEIGIDACESNETIETHPMDSQEHAYARARQIAKEMRMPLYLKTLTDEGDEMTELEFND